MTHSVKRGLQEAAGNAGRVLAGGFVAFCLYLGLVTFGPGLEGRFFPVITNYQLENIRLINGGGFSFRPSFVKARDCTYFGVTWFAEDDTGDLTRIQLGKQSDPSPPITGPVGQRTGERQTLFPPEGTVSIWALNHHQCGTPWQTRTMVGPFVVEGGRPSPTVMDGGQG